MFRMGAGALRVHARSDGSAEDPCGWCAWESGEQSGLVSKRVRTAEKGGRTHLRDSTWAAR